jgi:hypothetical protein
MSASFDGPDYCCEDAQLPVQCESFVACADAAGNKAASSKTTQGAMHPGRDKDRT